MSSKLSLSLTISQQHVCIAIISHGPAHLNLCQLTFLIRYPNREVFFTRFTFIHPLRSKYPAWRPGFKHPHSFWPIDWPTVLTDWFIDLLTNYLTKRLNDEVALQFSLLELILFNVSRFLEPKVQHRAHKRPTTNNYRKWYATSVGLLFGFYIA